LARLTADATAVAVQAARSRPQLRT